MDESASFWTQANALLRKDLTFQKRNIKTNIGLIVFPIFLCVLLLALQTLINKEFDKPQRNCGCKCITEDRDGNCLDKRCGVQYSDVDQAGTCSIPSPPEWPAFLQLPYPEFAAARSSNSSSFSDLPDESCRRTKSCPATVLFTGSNRSLAQRVAESLFISDSPNGANRLDSLPFFILGTDAEVTLTNFIEPAIFSPSMYIVRSQCLPNDSISFGFTVGAFSFPNETKCIQGLPLWRDSSSVINDELYKGYGKGNAENKINGIVAAYDFLNTSEQAFNAFVSYNSTYKKATQGPPTLIRITRSVNMVTNAFLSSLKGSGTKILLQFVKEMPKPATKLRLDFASLLGPLFFTWIVLLLFPVILQSLVYEKQKKLRIMMKMHGLGDGPYWLISYAYFFALSALYISCFVIFGSVIGLKFFTLNSYGIQFVFYFIYMNLQISLAFLLAIVFSNEMVAKVVGYICVFKAGLIGSFLFQFFVEDTSFPRSWIIVMEIIPLFSLFRGLYEFSQYSFSGNYMGTSGMRWSNLNDTNNGMKEILIIMAIEWLVMLPIAYYLDQVASVGSGVRKHPLFFLRHFRKYSAPSFRKPSLQRGGSKVFVEMDKPDVVEEREVVEKLMVEPSASYAIVCHNLRKTYPGRDGNPDKLAVKGISLALPRGECFGMLGPNGAGKTSFINMMIGLNVPTSGTAFVEGLNIRTDMDRIYNLMGVCPQYDLLWETLTGREHLLFYGRLKNLKGAALMDAVEESLKSVNLFHGGVGDKYAGKYSGGMKRRLSVAISLIGNPKVVYMDEPSTGLDPASRNNLWNVIQNAKRDRAIILTTHSMDEAEFLCDRLGIFVDGELQCIGNPKQLKSRYGGSYIFTMTTSSDREQDVRNLVHRLSPNAVRVYHISGTQKFEMPKQEVQISNVFREVEIAKSKFTIYAWGLVDTTLEDVFIKVAKGDSKG